MIVVSPKKKEVKPPKQQSGKRNVMSDGSVTSEAEPKKPAKKKDTGKVKVMPDKKHY